MKKTQQLKLPGVGITQVTEAAPLPADGELHPWFGPNRYRRKCVQVSELPSMTEQSHRDHVNINNIIAKYRKTGIVDHNARYQGTYMDITGVPEYSDALRIIADANTMFETLPADIREKFENNPGEFLEFMENPDNIEEIEALGLTTTHLPGQRDDSESPEKAPNDELVSGDTTPPETSTDV